MLYYDEPNGRQVDVFVGPFRHVPHASTWRTGSTPAPARLHPTDLLLTKLQVVEINRKDLVDALTVILTHEVVGGRSRARTRCSSAGWPRSRRADWGWYTTLTDNLARIAPRSHASCCDPDAASLVAARLAAARGGSC